MPENSTSSLKCKMLVLKVASRCNLNCSYCYVYNLGDTTYKTQPKVMSKSTVDNIINKVYEHCILHGISKFSFVFHGGEPLLAPISFYEYFVEKSKSVLEPKVGVIFSMQTNGVLLSEKWCKKLNNLNINFGISIDGPKEVNDMYRVDHKGKGSYDRIIKGLKLAQESKYLKIKPGLLSVINIHSNPDDIYNHLKTLKPRSVDFLFPEATFDTPPEKKNNNLKETPYANWLIRIFDLWLEEKEKPFSIRLFETYMLAIFEKFNGLDTVGDSNNEILVIETDGGIEPVGSLKVCGHGFTKIGANINEHKLDYALQTDLASLYNKSGQTLSDACKKCPIKKVCGAGYLPHRHSKIRAFDNPSVYCYDLMKLITHIQNSLLEKLPLSIRKKLNITPLHYATLKSLNESNLEVHFNR